MKARAITATETAIIEAAYRWAKKWATAVGAPYLRESPTHNGDLYRAVLADKRAKRKETGGADPR